MFQNRNSLTWEIDMHFTQTEHESQTRTDRMRMIGVSPNTILP